MRGALLIVCVYFLAYANAWKIFHNGRWNGGNLQPPSGPAVKSAAVQEKYYQQKLDQFDPSDTNVWPQRYFVNDEFYDQSKNTVFLMIGGEGEASDKWMTQGAWIESAKTYGALCFQLEHRFYGKSLPTSNYSTENLRFLTSEQALADLATFIAAMNVEYNLPSDVKWIAFGGSYPGSLAAWLRQQYPHLVHGAMSASGPLLAQVDFQDYYRVVAEDFVALHSQGCADAVAAAFQQVEDTLKTPQLANLNKAFQLCDPIEESVGNALDVSNFFSALAGNFAGIAQYNNDNRISGPLDVTVNSLCDIMTDASNGVESVRLAGVNRLLLHTYDQSCLDFKYDNMINYYKKDDVDYGGGRQWTYQTCTEFGFYQSSSHQPQVFGDQFPVDFSIQQCIDIFGDKFNSTFLTKAIDHTNVLYGALDIDVSNVVFVHGTVDPWHALGVLETIDEQAPAILINGTAHCANMYAKSDVDPPQLTAARETVDKLIGQWLAQ